MLINLKDALSYAENEKIALGSFNVYNVESLQAVLTGTKASKYPVIISFGESYDKHMPLEAMAALVHYYCQDSTRHYVLHLDHSKQEDTITRAIKAGFTSVMYDGSGKPLAENISMTKKIVALAHQTNVSVEGELGYMNNEDGSPADAAEIGSQTYTRVADAQAFSTETQVDALAIAIGNAHGIYKGTPTLDFERLQAIQRAVAVPLVLHGSSGIPHHMLQEAIQLGIRKININTEISTRGIAAARDFLQKNTNPNIRFEALTTAAETAMSEVVHDYVACFSSK